MSHSVKVVITGGAGQIAYAVAPRIANGDMLGHETHIRLYLLDVEFAAKALQGVVAELHDCAFPLLDEVVGTCDSREAFAGANIVVACGGFPRKPGMERKELLDKNKSIFQAQGAVIGEVAAPDCRVLVVANPANTNALALIRAASGTLKPSQVTALTRLDHNRACSLLARKAGAQVSDVCNVAVWGNHSGTMVIDVDHASIAGVAVREAVKDDAFIDGDFLTEVRGRGGRIAELRGLSSAMSAAQAIVEHIHDWSLGTAEGVHVSMAVYSDGNPYSVPDGLVYSFPCTCANGNWSIVPGLTISPETQEKLEATTKDLINERSEIE